MSNFKDLTGEKIGRLTVIKRVENNKANNAQWLCQCECGKEIITTTANLKRRHSKSCGCLRKEHTSGINNNFYKHGMYNTKLYQTWHNMKQRCFNKNSSHYKNYGGRGIKVCDEWLEFMNFYNWAMSNEYSEELTIDRIDVNGNYEPDNCRWVDNKTQCNNKRNNHLITYNGKTHTMMEWSRLLNIKYDVLRFRLKRGWDIEKALTERIKNGDRKKNK